MKSKFTSFDVACVVQELKLKILGLRVVNVYDINNKSYMIKLGQDVKTMLYIESGCRIHTTEFEWPKQMMPSPFSSKCRKVIRNKRLSGIKQIGCDRVIDLQFGWEEFSYHLIVELYDKGNICLCDHQFIITAILRTRQDEKEDVRYAVGHFYPLELCQTLNEPTIESLKTNLLELKPNTQLKRWLNFQYPFSIPLIEHCLQENGLNPDQKLIFDDAMKDIEIITCSLNHACELYKTIPSSDFKGFIYYKSIIKSSTIEKMMDEFHPYSFCQLKDVEFKEFSSYNESIDHFFYKQGTQKIEIKSIQKEKGVLKKLENIKKDHEIRIKSLQEIQTHSKHKAHLIEVNLNSVDEAIDIIQNAIANRLSWDEIDELVQEGIDNGHKIALLIKTLSLDRNAITMSLKDPYDEDSIEENVVIDLDIGGYGNAKKYFDEVKVSAAKELKTIQSSEVALKNAEKKTKATIKDINIVTSIKKARKTMWFEKFLWFMSSENYMIIGGRDAQQNEILVKRYLKKNDVYVHADIHGATSIIVKNKSNNPIPPKTLLETGCFALCHSAAWSNKLVISAYWVHAHQVSKTAPSGEYLTTGSFMIRGKKNYLPPSQLVLGFSVLFKIDDESVEKRRAALKLFSGSQQSKEILLNNETREHPIQSSLNKKENRSAIDEFEDEMKDDDMIQNNDDVVDELFDKYNLEISAVQKQNVTTSSNSTDFTEFIGAPHKAHYNKPRPSNNNNQEQHNQNKNSEPKKQSSQQKRGKRAKNKKLQKYADQSDDEREAKMALLGSAGTKKKKEKSKTSNTKLKYKPQSDAKNVVSECKGSVQAKEKLNEVQRVELTLEKFETEKKTTRDVNEEIMDIKDDINESKDSDILPITVELAQPSVQKTTPIKIDLDEASDTEDEPIDFLDSLVLNPNVSDSILFGIPFVAPYSVMSMCKYKCKLTPGAMKKGKASKTILDLFLREKDALIAEKNVFKSLKDVDVTVNIPGKVKISAPNLHGNKRK